MAETTRASNGKFVSKSPRESQPIEGIITGDDTIITGSGVKLDQGTVNPTDIDRQRDTGSGPGQAKRGPGRPAGSGKKEEGKPKTEAKLDLNSLNFTLFFAHELLAKATKTPEIALDELEAKRMAECCMNVMQHYNIKASQKAIDWGNLILTGGIIYAGKFNAIKTRQNAEAKAKKESQNSTIDMFNIPR